MPSNYAPNHAPNNALTTPTGCNEITEPGLWSCLSPRIISLSITDCINVADDTMGAISQLMPSLRRLELQVRGSGWWCLLNTPRKGSGLSI